jgi:hypothetical protein
MAFYFASEYLYDAIRAENGWYWIFTPVKYLYPFAPGHAKPWYYVPGGLSQNWIDLRVVAIDFVLLFFLCIVIPCTARRSLAILSVTLAGLFGIGLVYYTNHLHSGTLLVEISEPLIVALLVAFGALIIGPSLSRPQK